MPSFFKNILLLPFFFFYFLIDRRSGQSCELKLTEFHFGFHVQSQVSESSDMSLCFSTSAHSRRPVNGAAANQITRCTAWCRTVPFQSASTPCTSRSNAAPSVKMVNSHFPVEPNTLGPEVIKFSLNQWWRVYLCYRQLRAAPLVT